MSSYIFIGQWEGISSLLRERHWNNPVGYSVQLHDVSTKKPALTPENHTEINVKAGSHYTQKLSITYLKNPPKAQSDKERLLRGSIRKRTGKNKSFDIVALKLSNFKDTLILLTTKDPDAHKIPDDMMGFIKEAKEKHYLQNADAAALQTAFQNMKNPASHTRTPDQSNFPLIA